LWDVTPQKIVLFLNGIKLFLPALYYPSMCMVRLKEINEKAGSVNWPPESSAAPFTME
jgi:hypothetical protein